MLCTVVAGPIKLNLDVRRKYSLITGDSATGKTYLSSLLAKLGRSGFKFRSPYFSDIFSPLQVDALENYLEKGKPNSIVLIDEEVFSGLSPELIALIHRAKMFFVFMTRSTMPLFSISHRCVFTLESDTNKKTWTMTPLNVPTDLHESPDLLVTEDRCSGFDFFKSFHGSKCASSDGASNLYRVLTSDACKGKKVNVVCDMCSIGFHLSKLILLTRLTDRKIALAPIESFEHLLLHARLLHPDNFKFTALQFLEFPPNSSIDNPERWYTQALSDLMQSRGFRYSKSLRLSDSILMQQCPTCPQRCSNWTSQDSGCLSSIIDVCPSLFPGGGTSAKDIPTVSSQLRKLTL